MTTTPALLKPSERPCVLREKDHKYIYMPTGQRMKTSVTGIISNGRESFYPKKANIQRDIGIHTHAWLHEWAKGKAENFRMECPQGHDCTPWIKALEADESLNSSEILATEFTMVDCDRGFGGQLDILIRTTDEKTLLVDLKTKTKNWVSPSKKDRYEYKCQAGGYLDLFWTGTDAGNARQIKVDECQTLIVKPWEAVWLDPYQVKTCSKLWRECWESYADTALIAF